MNFNGRIIGIKIDARLSHTHMNENLASPTSGALEKLSILFRNGIARTAFPDGSLFHIATGNNGRRAADESNIKI